MKFNLLLFAIWTLISGSAAAVELDSFAHDHTAWEFKDWGDSARIALAPAAQASSPSLLVSFEASGKAPSAKGIVVRRSLLGRVDAFQNFTFDLYVDAPAAIDLIVSFEADQFYQLPPKRLVQGWNRDITVDLLKDKFSSGAIEGPYDLQPRPDLYLGSLVLAFKRSADVKGTVAISRVRSQHDSLLRPRQKPLALKAVPLRFGSITGDRTSLETYQTLEWTIDLATPVLNPFDPKEITLDAIVRSPKGDRRRVGAFLYSGQVDLQNPSAGAVWKVRFTPELAGTWSYEFEARRGREAVTTAPVTFEVKPAKDSKASDGFVRIDRKDPYSFAFDSGRSYYPIGQNVAWGGMDDYEKIFKSMAENGENWARIWMSHWSFGIEWKPMGDFRGLTNFNLKKAEQLDRLVAMATRYGIYLQLVFDFHGAFSSRVNPEWLNNPYNKVNGGMLTRAEDFFTNSEAKEVYKKRVRYIVSRWGSSPHILAWEFFNEVSYTDHFDDAKVTAWHDEMSRFVKEIDPYQHLRTTSYGGEFKAGAFALHTIDFSQFHAYTSNIHQQLRYVHSKLKRYGKPYFIGEFGSNTNNGVDELDTAGTFLHAGIWSQFMHDAGGNAMPWWWDSHIEKHQLYGHFGALARFAEGIDRRAYTFTPVRERLRMPVAGKDYVFELIGLHDKKFSLFWLSDIEGMKGPTPDGKTPKLLAYRDVKIILKDFTAPVYELEFWDTRSGRILETKKARSEQGQLKIELPRFTNDLAFKVRPQPELSLGHLSQEEGRN